MEDPIVSTTTMSIPTTTDPTTSPLPPYDKLYENLIFAIGPITFLIAAKRGRKAWIRYEIFVSTLIALILASKPDIFLSFVVYKIQITNSFPQDSII